MEWYPQGQDNPSLCVGLVEEQEVALKPKIDNLFPRSVYIRGWTKNESLRTSMPRAEPRRNQLSLKGKNLMLNLAKSQKDCYKFGRFQAKRRYRQERPQRQVRRARGFERDLRTTMASVLRQASDRCVTVMNEAGLTRRGEFRENQITKATRRGGVRVVQF